MKPGRLWHPLDVEFWDDPDTLAVGESAAVLFLRLIAYSKKHQTDGWVPMTYVKQAGGRRWKSKLEPIVCQGWAVLSDNPATIWPESGHDSGSKWCHIVAFLAWNDSSESVEQRREIAREKKRKQRGAMPNVPRGQTAPVPALSPDVELELETEVETTPNGVPPNPPGGERDPDSFEARSALLLREHAKRYESATGNCVPSAKNAPQDVGKVVAFLAGLAARRSQPFAVVVVEALDAWWPDTYAAAKGWPMWHLARHIDEFTGALPALRVVAGGMTRAATPAEHAADAAEGTGF